MTVIKKLCWVVLILALYGAGAARAADDPKLQACLKKADDMPDIAAADAESWMKHGGGEAARLCRAFAQFHRGEFADSAKLFSDLAAGYDKTDMRNAAAMHAQAGLGYMRANDWKRSEAEYAAALKLAPDDVEVIIDRATERAVAQHYWDAIADLNHALKLKPDNVEALRMRAQAWVKLGNEHNAMADFTAAEDIDAAVKVKP